MVIIDKWRIDKYKFSLPPEDMEQQNLIDTKNEM